MKLVNAARLSIAFLIVVFTLSLSLAVLSGGGFGSGSYKANNTDPRTVFVQVALVGAAPTGSSSPAIDLLRDRFAPGSDGAKSVDHAAFAQAIGQARQLVSPADVWLAPALAAQHGEEATFSITPDGAETPVLDLAIAPSVLDKNVIRSALKLDLAGASHAPHLSWSTTLTFRDGAVIAVDLTSIDPATNQATSMLLLVRASIITEKPN